MGRPWSKLSTSLDPPHVSHHQRIPSSMADQDRSIIIKDNPIGNGLDVFRASFNSVCNGASISCNPDALEQLGQEGKQQNSISGYASDHRADIQNLVLDLLFALGNHPRSKTSHGTHRNDLLKLISAVNSRDIDLDRIKPLLKAALDVNPDDTFIWEQVHDAVTTSTPPPQPIASALQRTPPQSVSISFDGTPVVRSTSSFQGKEQTKKILDQALLYELRGRIFRGVDGFFEKYFEGQSWIKRCKSIYQSIKPRHVDGRWADFPDPPTQDDVWAWLVQFQDDFLLDAPATYHSAQSTSSMTGGDSRRQLDIFLKPKHVKTPTHDWKDILVIGEHKQSHLGPKELLLQLSRYMRDLFTTQPTRRFAHGFFLHGTKMELWVFDRSGPYSSGEFDIHEEPERFILSLAGYVFMSDQELGLDTFIDCRGTKRTITFTNDVGGKRRKLQLDQEPFVKQRAVVCRGTTCFRTTDHNNVVKFSWTSDKRPPEADHLRLAYERGVEGIAQFVGYQSITSIADLRSGLTFNRPWTIRCATGTELTSSRSLISQPLQLLRVSTGEPNGGSTSLPGSLARAVQPVFHNSYELKKRASVDDDDTTAAKRQRANSQASGLRHELKPDSLASLYEPSPDMYDNRQFGCLAISPAGRALDDFTTLSELLTALRDAIKAHRSLYLVGKILHRDISENNIIITDPRRANGFTGMLIDLDLAKQVGSSRSGARHQTGTMQFMAIEVLRKAAHTFRHDLESFFYVLLWICGRRTWELGFLCDPKCRPPTDKFKKWYSGGFEEIADAKLGDMHVDGFDTILAQFPKPFECVKPLCSELRRILFPCSAEGRLCIGTPPEPGPLYDAIIGKFDDAISGMASHPVS